MKEGDVVLAQVPQADGTLTNRPALLLRELPPFRDFLVCGMSRRTHQAIPDFDDVISPADPDFKASGLVAESVVRLGFLGVLPRKKVLGSIGSIAAERHERLLRRLSAYLVERLRRRPVRGGEER
jgi:mRNA interferase MazF